MVQRRKLRWRVTTPYSSLLNWFVLPLFIISSIGQHGSALVLHLHGEEIRDSASYTLPPQQHRLAKRMSTDVRSQDSTCTGRTLFLFPPGVTPCQAVQQCVIAPSNSSSEYPSRRVPAPRSTYCSRRRSASVVFLFLSIFCKPVDREGGGMVPPGGCASNCVFQRAIRDETYISTEDADNVWFTSSPSNPVRLCFCGQGRRPRSRTSSFRKRINFRLQMASPSSNLLGTSPNR